MAHQPIAWFIESGTSKTIPAQLTQDDGVTPLDLSEATTIRFVFKASMADLDSAAKITMEQNSGVSVLNRPLGDVSVSFLPAQTAIYYAAPITLYWACRVFFSQIANVIGAYGTLQVIPVGISGITP